jgi:hypothetical protein
LFAARCFPEVADDLLHISIHGREFISCEEEEEEAAAAAAAAAAAVCSGWGQRALQALLLFVTIRQCFSLSFKPHAKA